MNTKQAEMLVRVLESQMRGGALRGVEDYRNTLDKDSRSALTYLVQTNLLDATHDAYRATLKGLWSLALVDDQARQVVAQCDRFLRSGALADCRRADRTRFWSIEDLAVRAGMRIEAVNLVIWFVKDLMIGDYQRDDDGAPISLRAAEAALDATSIEETIRAHGWREIWEADAARDGFTPPVEIVVAARMSVREDFALLLKFLYDLACDDGDRSSGVWGVPAIAERLAWKPPRLNRAIELLERSRFVKCDESLGSEPYYAHGLELTAEGMLAGEQLTDGADRIAALGKLEDNVSVKIFISHSSKDADVAEAVADLMRDAFSLQPEAIRCTSATKYELDYGTDSGQLRAEVVDAAVVLGVITGSSMESSWVMFELGARWGAGKYFVAMVASDSGFALLPDPINTKHALKITSDEKLVKLVEEVASKLGVERPRHAAYQERINKLLKVVQAASAAAAKPAPDAAPPKHLVELSDKDKRLLFRESLVNRIGKKAGTTLTVNLKRESSENSDWSGLPLELYAEELQSMHSDGTIEITQKSDAIIVVRVPFRNFGMFVT